MSFRTITALTFLISFMFNSANAEEIITSPNDNRLYKNITLSNQLQVLLISDPNTDRAAASLDIDVGSASNPKDRQGLAHFLEHMLFLGTKKYPDANEYADFISANGGSHNAFTARDNTNYFFDVKPDALPGALDRFSQFFITPLFTPKYVQRERKAVHSEYQSQRKDDSQRNHHAFKQIINPKHPDHQFYVGSLTTLADTEHSHVRDDLISFYNQYYSANRMTLVVLGSQSLTELEALVTQKFSAIKNTHAQKPVIEVVKINKQRLPLMLKVKSIKDIRILTLSFITPAQREHYQLKPLQYLGSLLGYEGQGSLLAYLKKQGYANDLSTSSHQESPLESYFQTSISLTPKGMAEINQVISSFFSFIEQIKLHGIKPELYLEQAKLSAQAFEFVPKQHASSYVVSLSQSMRNYPVQHWLNAGYIMQGYSPDILKSYLSEVNAQNMLINIQAKDIATDRIEPYFKTQYSVQPISTEQLQQWRNPVANNELFVRSLNPFISESFELVKQTKNNTSNIPNKQPQALGSTLWHMGDNEFLTPKSTIFFNLLMQDQPSAAEKLSLSLYSQLLRDHLNKLIYDARSAGVYLQIYANSRGLSVKISGYSEKQNLLLQQLKDLGDVSFDPARFNIIKANLKRSLENSASQKPYQQLISLLLEKLTFRASTDENLQLLSALSLTDVAKIQQKLLSKAELKILAHGNLTIETAKSQAHEIASIFNVQSYTQTNDDRKYLKLKSNETELISKSIDSADSAVILYLQGPDSSYKTRAATALITEALANDYEHELRTEQQLGYIVFSSAMNVRKLPGLALIVQTPTASLIEVQQSNQTFLAATSEKLSNLTQEQLAKYKYSLISKYQQKERSIYQRSNRFWQDINNDVEKFDERAALIEAINELESSDLQLIYSQLLTRKMEVHSERNL